MTEEIIISSESEGWELLEKALANEIGSAATITFQDWPVFNLTIEGRDFHGTIPTRIMPSIMDLQKEIHRLYCKAKYRTEDIRKLTQDEKDQLELVVSVKPGSSNFFTELFNALNEVIKNSNMDGTQALILVLGIGMMITSVVCWKEWVQSKERLHSKETTVRLSEEETKRTKIITDAMKESSELKKDKEDVDAFRSNISRKLKPTDQIRVDNEPIINGEMAAEIIPSTKEESEDIRIDGEFIINQVKFPNEYGGKYRLPITCLFDDKNIMVDASPDTLTQEDISILKESGFSVKRILMQINAKQLRDQITSANLISIQWPKRQEISN
ncbi:MULTISPECIES: hypothetical protein [Nitrosomonas]|uniref:Uncharacterized protein n=1 Tax=Nitrosomonas communis TaxID=44574 RepID=A0A0F7KEU1_9PROT|nr:MULTISPECIES: hypothetical protein [Nitrosomonas]AKH37352.1 hypothetical protein AAW31_05290 [Nitrosomonas communis]TYP78314.1 hypothetical protein BCL69_107720 [Nitrosomonas communis]UVS62574.1 hypothetical protein NX761_05485 [Nitrosomonas sp. PLL12]